MLIKPFKNLIRAVRSSKSLNQHKVYNHLDKPFVLEDLRPVPANWLIKPPDFVGISSPKAGTSWWYSLLLDHPQVENNRLSEKELSYFFHFQADTISEDDIFIYRQAFAAPKNSISGEWSPSYLWFPLALDNLLKTVPQSKLIIMLRNPIDRYLSHLNQASISNNEIFGHSQQLHRNVHKFWAFPDSMLQGLLAPSLKKLLNKVDRDKILMLQYEKCKNKTFEEIARTYRFLEIDDKYVPQSISKAVNKKEYVIDSLSLSERKNLADYYHDDVFEITQMFPEIDLSLWKDF